MMKPVRSFLLLAIALVSMLSSCKKSDSTAPYGKLKISIANEVDGKPVVLGPMSYTSPAGNQYSIDLLKYYISNVRLVRPDGSEKAFSNYNLIDASDSTSQSITLDSVQNGDYTAMKFMLGVDQEHNHTIGQSGALDPINGMVWTWSTGYIFFKHEGSFKDSTGATKQLLFHYGTDFALVNMTVPISQLTVAGNERKLYLKFNLNKLYDNPRRVDFNHDNNHMSTSADDAFWISALSENFRNTFQYVKAE
jgi:hypothetical protein